MTTLDEPPQDPFEPIAVVGISALFPDSPDVNSFWQNILDAKVSLKEVPSNRWIESDFWVKGGPKDVEINKTYSKIGAWVEGFEFDWRRWRVPPGSLLQIDPTQLWAVSVSSAALEDAGYLIEGGSELPKERTGVIFANALGGENRNLSNHRIWADQFARHAIEAGGMPESGKDAFKEAMLEGLPNVDEDTMPGELANVVAGRVANLLDLQGPNYATDAACATTFAAILDACRLLQTRQVDVMIAGASDRTMDPATFAKFSAIGALSATHSTPFDAKANGFVMGEGAGAVVLKRLSDAIQDGNQIHAVIRGVGASSDGRGKGITAPSTRGQIQAVMRAYQQAGYSTESVQLIEAHGTSTVVGDATELTSLSTAFSTTPSGNSVAVGSIKSQIGHLKSAAGMAGLLKAIISVREGVIPPSAGFKNPNENISWQENPFYVPTTSNNWPSNDGHPRRAGISSFGFGGTNFHCAIESYDPGHHLALAEEFNIRRRAWLNPKSTNSSVQDVPVESGMTWEELRAVEGGVLLLNASTVSKLKEKAATVCAGLLDGENLDESPSGKRLSIELSKASADYIPEGVRLAIIASDWGQLAKRSKLLQDSIDNPEKWGFLSKQMIMITDSPTLSDNEKVAQLYPGQGSQYVGMTFDLSKRYTCVGATWDEADSTMVKVLDGEKLSSFVLRDELSEEERKDAEFKLKQTEYTQPAMLTADLAIYRLLKAHGLEPDMVAGHSLGEYAALMVAEILDFDSALRAVAARGTEMGSVEISDCGIMASVTAPYEQIELVLKSEEGYVIAANKNSPKMTVIAGESEPMKRVMKEFEKAGVNCVQLQTSHAFHSKIVAPANEPLRRFLEGLEISLPKIPITSNFDGGWYPNEISEGGDVKQAILSKLAPQMASAVEWTKQIETMYVEGARLFVEVGPKRALALFSEQILEKEQILVTNTNHPKVGGIASFHAALAMHALAGRVPHLLEPDSPHLTAAFRTGVIQDTKLESSHQISATSLDEDTRNECFRMAKESFVADIVAAASGFPRRMIHGSVDLVALGIRPEQMALIEQTIRDTVQVNGSLSTQTLPGLVEWLAEIPGGQTAAIARFGPQSVPSAKTPPVSQRPPVQRPILNPISNTKPTRHSNPFVISGISLGLPGMDEVFAPDALDRIIAGENFISELSDDLKQKLLDKNLVRIIKHPDGSAEFVPCNSFDLIPQLAGRGGYFNLSEQYGVDSKISEAMDIATSLALAAGLEALKDAGLPLVAVEQTNKAGKRLIQKWHLPPSERDRTGVVFASCFPGLDMAMKHARNDGVDEEGHFNRRFLLQVLSMGHSQFAQWIGARGPNTAVNNACASTPAAFAIAEDWIATGRCDRVIVVSGDDATSDELMQWIGAGFAAAGAHAMGDVVEEVSLPFDARRNGMLLGMGAAAFVMERSNEANDRGVTPYVELLGAHIGNSAHHPTRLDVEHVSESLESFIGRMEDEWEIDRHEIAPKLSFMSHEPATPPRGGSAAAEIHALRRAFGDSASKIIITNTKGFTGHPMGVGIEDAVAIRGLVQGEFPPIANFREPDPELGDLRLSKGGAVDTEYVLRHAAGFGSQMALTLLKRVATNLDRIDRNIVASWTAKAVGNVVDLRILKRKLVAYINPDENILGGIEGDEYARSETEPTPVITSDEPMEVVKVPIQEETVVNRDVETKVIEVVVKHTGYPADFIELDQDLEGELGIDTVKQAEIMAELREFFGLPVDESFVLSEHPTLNHMIAYLGGDENVPVTTASVIAVSASAVIEEPVEVEEESASTPATVTSDVANKVIEVVVKHTGYPADFIELDQDLEGELGIDTVKQAEIMAELREFFGLPVDESFVLSEHPTLNHMIAYLSQGDSTVVSPMPAPSETSEKSPVASPVYPDSISTGVRRWQVEVEEAPPEAASPLDIDGKVIAVTDDPWGVADTLCHILEAADIDTVRIMLDPSIVSRIKIEKDGPVDIIRVDPNNRKQLSEVSQHLANVGEVVALLHLAPLHLAGVGWESETQAAHLASTTHGLFGLLKSLDNHFSTISDGTIMSVTAMDGNHGNASDRFNALAAGAHGIVKSYAKEQPHLRSRAVDVDPDMLAEPTALAHQIWAEAFGRTSPIEVGLARDGSRWSMRLYEEDLVEERKSLESDDVWVVSGGGSGVTARCIIGVAEASKDVGTTFILLGRTRLDASIEEWLYDDEEALQARKDSLRQNLLASSENGKVTMVEWEREWGKQMRSLDIHRTIHAIRATGNRALYDACDVTNVKSVAKVFSAVRKEYNTITGLIHGAGMEDSKLVSDKSWDTFSEVVSIKIDGWRAMIDALGSSINDLRVVCAFTSVAGRFGNGGQVDYAAANNILDAEMCRIAHHADAPRAIAIAWSGWKDVGMATRGSIETVFAQAGIEMISIETGVNLFVDEMLAGGKRRVVAAGSLGVLDSEESKRDPPQKLPEDTTGLLAEPERFPFVDRVLDHEPYVEISTECTLDVSRFPFLIDHAIDGTPYHPGVMALEMFSEAALLLYPMCTMAGFSDVEFGLPVKLVKEEVKLRVRAAFSGQSSSEIHINCILESDLINSKGEIFGEPRIHHSATVRLLKEGGKRDTELPFNAPPGRSKASFQPSFIYQRFFHGPRFQVLGGLVKGVQDGEDFGADGIALLRNLLPNPSLFGGDESEDSILLESSPMLIEACFQNAGLVAMEIDALSSLPIGIKSVNILKSPSTRDNLRVRSFRRGIEGEGITVHDAIVFDGNQKPLIILVGLRLKGMATVPDELRFELSRKSN